MPGSPGQSKLAPFDANIERWFHDGATYRDIAERLRNAHGLTTTHNAVFSYVTAKCRRHRFHRSFLAGLDADLRESLMRRLVAEWTHNSTAIEGNTLTLGETLKVLEYGLTISGKPLVDHEEVVGHARAIAMIESMVGAKSVATEDLFELHRTVMPRVSVDALKPVGAWKRDYNGTSGVVEGRTVYMEYARPEQVPALMEQWLAGFNERLDVGRRRSPVLKAYQWSHQAFVRIHPFFDGNGRMARLLANLPVLRAGFPPLMIDARRRLEYIECLWNYQWSVGPLKPGGELVPENDLLKHAGAFFAELWHQSMALVEQTRKQQHARN